MDPFSYYSSESLFSLGVGVCVDIPLDLFIGEFSFWTGFTLLCRDSEVLLCLMEQTGRTHKIDYNRFIASTAVSTCVDQRRACNIRCNVPLFLRAEFDEWSKSVICLQNGAISCRASLLIMTQRVAMWAAVKQFGVEERIIYVWGNMRADFPRRLRGVQNYVICRLSKHQ